MIDFFCFHQGLDLFEVSFCHLAAQGNKSAGIAAIKPTIVANFGMQHDISQPARGVGQARLGAMNAADHNFKKVPRREIVQLFIDWEHGAKKFSDATA